MADSRTDWAAVETIDRGTRIEVELHEDAAPAGSRTIAGDFQGGTADTLTVTLPGGQTRLLEQAAVHRLRVRRAFFGRPSGWLAFAIMAGAVTAVYAPHADISRDFIPILWGLSFAGAMPFFRSAAMATVYEVPRRVLRLITGIDVGLTDGEMIRPDQAVTVAVSHAVGASRPRTDNIGLTVCLSSQPARCDGRSAIHEGRVADLANPFSARLPIGDQFPLGAERSLYVHAVLMEGSWRPATDPRVPQLGEVGVLDVETVTRRVTVAER